MNLQTKPVYEFDSFRLDPAEQLLLADGKIIPLPPKAFELLLVMVEHAGHLMEKDDLLAAAWPGTFVQETNLTSNISHIRKALGESGNGLQFIETVPKRGYRFVAQVKVVEGTPAPLQKIEAARHAVEAGVENKVSANAIAGQDVSPARVFGSDLPLPFWTGRRLALSAIAIVLALLLGMAGWLVLSPPTSKPPELSMKAIPLTSLPGRELYPTFSPDGDRVAFAWNGEKGDNYDIYVKAIGTETPLRLTTDPAEDTSPAWAPDGKSIAFVRISENERMVLAVPVLGGPERKLHSVKVDSQPLESIVFDSEFRPGLSWSPDGQFLAFSETRSPGEYRFSVFLLSLSSLEKQELTSPPPATRGDWTPAFSPDGKTVAFSRWNTGASSEIYLVATAGGIAKRLTFDNRIVSGLDWTADGKQIVFSSTRADRRGLHNLWKIPPSGGPAQLLTGSEGALYPAISRTGYRVAYMQESMDLNIWRIDALGSSQGQPSATRLISSTRRDISPQYSRDGQRIVFVSNRSGSREIWVCDSDGSKARPITSMGVFLGSPRWSPDGQQIAFDARLEGHNDIFVVSSEGGKPRRVTVEPSEDSRASWSHDGRWIYFGSNQSGRREVWKVPTEGGAPTQVTRHGGSEAFESFDGKLVYYTKGPVQTIPGIWTKPGEGGDEVRILDQAYSGLWALLNTGIVFLRPQTKSLPTLEFFNFATRQITRVATVEKEPDRATPSLAVSPDGRWILYAQVDQVDSDIVLVEDFR
jgi:Tol biopolymer transport system component/DNA-binding winged helix-turn-helix (wHTH) protein